MANILDQRPYSRVRRRLDTGAELDDVADNLSAVVDVGIIISKVLKDRMALPQQVMLYREFVRAMFTASPGGQEKSSNEIRKS